SRASCGWVAVSGVGDAARGRLLPSLVLLPKRDGLRLRCAGVGCVSSSKTVESFLRVGCRERYR
ncbi:MAG: hypothetical protein AAF488_10100, partial [Planctomycetota bacterium]